MTGKAGSGHPGVSLSSAEIVTAEEHLQHGGLESTIAQVLANCQPVPMEFFTIKDTHAKSGKPGGILQQHGLATKDIKQAIRQVIKRKAS